LVNLFHLHHLPVEHKDGGVLLESDANEQILHGAGSTVVAAIAGIGQTGAGCKGLAAGVLHPLLRQHLHVDELEVAHTAVAASLPNARGVHRQHINKLALLQMG